MHLATGAFDPGRGYTSPPGLEPHVVDLPQRSVPVVDLLQRSGCLGYGDWNTWRDRQV
jgi:hypothetical protein